MSNQEAFQIELEESIAIGDRPKINKIIETIEPTKLDDMNRIKFLETLKKARYFPETSNAAKRFSDLGFDQPRILKIKVAGFN